MTGQSRNPDSWWAFATIAYDAGTGEEIWRRVFRGLEFGAQASAIAVSPDGATVFVTGETLSFATEEDVAVVAYDAETGTRRWARIYDGPLGGVEKALAIAVHPTGSHVYVTGAGVSPGGEYGYLTIAYDAETGARSWLRRYPGPVDSRGDTATAIGVSPDGSLLYVTGESWGETSTGSTTSRSPTMRRPARTAGCDGSTGRPLTTARWP